MVKTKPEKENKSYGIWTRIHCEQSQFSASFWDESLSFAPVFLMQAYYIFPSCINGAITVSTLRNIILQRTVSCRMVDFGGVMFLMVISRRLQADELAVIRRAGPCERFIHCITGRILLFLPVSPCPPPLCGRQTRPCRREGVLSPAGV